MIPSLQLRQYCTIISALFHRFLRTLIAVIKHIFTEVNIRTSSKLQNAATNKSLKGSWHLVPILNFSDEYFEEKEENLQENNLISRVRNSKDDCKVFITIGSILGCLLVAASLMMCLLSARLLKLTRKYKREKLEGVVREHRMKFGSQPTLFSTSGNSNFGQRWRQWFPRLLERLLPSFYSAR